MYSLNHFCWICSTKDNIIKLTDEDNDGITHMNKLTSSIAEMEFEELNNMGFICEECCITLNTVYTFRQTCLRSKINLITYISQLQTYSKVSGKIIVRLKDIQKEIKVEKPETNKECNLQDSTSDNIYASVTIKNEYDSEENIPLETFIFENDVCTDIKEEMENISTQDYRVRNGAENVDIDIEEETENHYVLEDSFKDHKEDITDELDFRCDSGIVFKEIEVMDNMTIQDYCVRKSDNFENKNLDIDNKDEIGDFDNYEEYINEDLAVHCKEEIDIEELSLSQLKNEPMYTETPQDGSTSHVEEELKNIIVRHICQICKKEFRKKIYLTEHMKNHSSVRTYECEICQKSFLHSMLFTKHMATHNQKRLHECLVCGKNFKRAGVLTNHMRVHTGERPYECEICKKKFTQTAALYGHMQTHNGKRSYECDVCKKTFTRRGILHNHKRLHTHERLFECKICKKTFKQSAVLYGHMRSHTGERPYECEICKMKFSLKYSCSRHMVTKHSNGNTRPGVANKSITID